jgi:hypothetical protein
MSNNTNITAISSQDTGLFRTNTKEQYYTTDTTAKYCIDKLLLKIPELVIRPGIQEYIWLEPSAGAGSFVNNIPATIHIENRIALDIEPAAAGIHKQDYLSWDVPQPSIGKKYLVFGNPPFGRQSSLAKLFIAKSCKFAEIIAFILPKSFVKPSMNRVFSSEFHCIHSEDLPSNSFLLNGTTAYDVPCVFQIWQKQDTSRIALPEIQPLGYKYLKPAEPYDIVIRRIGIYAGKAYNPVLTQKTTYSKQSHYFISLEQQYIRHVSQIIEKINAHVFPSNTVGPRSLSKSEVNEVINRILADLSLL